jgi:hypothetical protein
MTDEQVFWFLRFLLQHSMIERTHERRWNLQFKAYAIQRCKRDG